MAGNEYKVNILLTRSKSQATHFIEPLRHLPVDVHCVPVIQTILWQKDENVRILKGLMQYDWLFFTSAKGVRFFFEQMKTSGTDPGLLEHKKIAAVGPGTKDALEARGHTVHFVPEIYDAEHMGREFLQLERPNNVLLIKGELSRKAIDERFEEYGIRYDNLFVYRTVINEKETVNLNRITSDQRIDLLVFTSPSSIEAFIEMIEKVPAEYMDLPSFCIGRTTQEAAREAGFTQTYVPKAYTLKGLAEKVADYLKEADNEPV